MKIYCYECGEQISSTAVSCPKCGAAQNRLPSAAAASAAGAPAVFIMKEKKVRPKYLLFIFVVTLVTLCVFGVNALLSLPTFAIISLSSMDFKDAAVALFAVLVILCCLVLFIGQIINLVLVTQVKNEEYPLAKRFKFSSAVKSLSVTALIITCVKVVCAIILFIASSGDINSLILNLIIDGGVIGIMIPTVIKASHYLAGVKQSYSAALAEAKAAGQTYNT